MASAEVDDAFEQLRRVGHERHDLCQRLQRLGQRRDAVVGQVGHGIEDIADGLKQHAEGVDDAGVLNGLAAVLDHGGDVAVEFFEVRGKLDGQLVFDALLRVLQAGVGVVDGLKRFERVVVQHIAHVVGFLRVFAQLVAAQFDDGVQLLCGLGHEIHSQCVPLGLVFHLAERVDGIVKYILRAAEAAVGVCNLNFQPLVRLVGVARTGRGLLHLVGGFLEAVLDTVKGDVREVGHVVKLLHGIGRRAGHGGERQQIVRIRGGFLRHGDQRFFRLDDRRRDGGKSARNCDCRSVELQHAVHGRFHAVRQLDPELGGQAVHHVAEVAHAFPGFLGRIPDFAHALRGFPGFLVGFCHLLGIALQLVLHFVELGFRVCELLLPAAGFYRPDLIILCCVFKG